MKEIKTIELDSGFQLEALFEDGAFKTLTVVDAPKNLTREEVQSVFDWLKNTVLATTLGDIQKKAQESEAQLQLPLKGYDELADRRVGDRGALAGVEVFDRSNQIPKGQTVKFTVPKKAE